MTTSKSNSRRAGGAAENGTAVQRKTRRAKAPAAAPPAHEDLHASIARAAYFRSERRGFAPGYELEDWLAAEREVNQRLQRKTRTSKGERSQEITPRGSA